MTVIAINDIRELNLLGYDCRRSTGTMSAPEVHKMAKAMNPKVSKPRAPKSRTLEEINNRAKSMGVLMLVDRKEIVLYPPKFNEFGEQVGNNLGQYTITTQKGAWQALDEIALNIVKGKSNNAIADESVKARELIGA